MIDVGSIVITAVVFFIVGFKISAWMSKRHIERLKKVWGK